MTMPGQSNPWILIEQAASKSMQEDFFSLIGTVGRFGVDAQGQGAMHYCATYGHTSWIEKLSSLGLDVGCVDAAGNLPLDLAILMGHVQAALVLIELGSPVAAYNGSGRQPIHASASSPAMFPVLEQVVETGCRIDARDRTSHRTALHFACENDCLDAVVLLLAHGADPWARSASGQIPRDLAPDGTPSADYIGAICSRDRLQDECHASQNPDGVARRL